MGLAALLRGAPAVGLVTALAVAGLDQASKLWLLRVLHLDRGSIVISPMLEFSLVWNPGISYGLLRQTGWGRWILLAVSVVAIALLLVWLARTASRFTALALGLIIGGALGNAVDRLAYGKVAD